MLKQITRAVVAITALCSMGALAQTATGSGTAGAGNGGQVEITITGVVTSSVSLDIVGTGTTALAGTTSGANPVAGTGTLDFGTFSTQNAAAATNTSFAGRTALNDGAIVAGSLSATLTFNGATTGTVTVARQAAAGALPDVPAGNLAVATPALAGWTAITDGTAIPNPGTSVDVCTGVAGACNSGQAYVHELAVFVPDTQAAGAFSTVVTYTGTAL
ncbi:MAG: hypothetical protein ACKVPX_13565 [Myxococcaceae bacterium]